MTKEDKPAEPSKLYKVGHALVAIGIVYVPIAYLVSKSATSATNLAGMIAVPVFFLGLGGLLMFLGRRRD